MPSWWCWLCPRLHQGMHQCQEEGEAGTEDTFSSPHSGGGWWLQQDVVGVRISIGRGQGGKGVGW